MPSAITSATHCPAPSTVEKPIRSARGLRLGKDPHRHLGNHAQKTLGTDDDAQQIKACRVQLPATQPDDLAIHQHQFDAQDIVGCQSIFQAVHATGILRDVAADRTGDLAGGIGRVIKAALLHGLGDGEIGHARLHDGNPVLIIDVDHPLELAEAKQDGVGQRQRPARQRRARSARHHLHPLGMAPGEYPGHLLRRFGKDDE